MILLAHVSSRIVRKYFLSYGIFFDHSVQLTYRRVAPLSLPLDREADFLPRDGTLKSPLLKVSRWGFLITRSVQRGRHSLGHGTISILERHFPCPGIFCDFVCCHDLPSLNQYCSAGERRQRTPRGSGCVPPFFKGLATILSRALQGGLPAGLFVGNRSLSAHSEREKLARSEMRWDVPGRYALPLGLTSQRD